MQFHTPESYSVAQATHPLYELFRRTDEQQERSTLELEIMKESATVATPEGAERLPQREEPT